MRVSATLLVTTVALAACAIHTEPAHLTEPLLSFDDQPTECAPSPLPRQLPSAGRLLDTVGLRQELSDVLNRIGANELAVTMWFQGGVLDLVTVVDPPADTALNRSLHDLLRPIARPEEPGEWTVRLNVSDDGGVLVERSRYCPPSRRPSVRSVVRVPFTVEGTEQEVRREVREIEQAGPFRIRVLVDAAGRAANAQLTQSSGNELMDRSMLDAARKSRFHPATVDGVPVPGWWVMMGGRTP